MNFEWLTKKEAGLPVWAWALIGAVILYLGWHLLGKKGSGTSSPPLATQQAQDTGLPEDTSGGLDTPIPPSNTEGDTGFETIPEEQNPLNVSQDLLPGDKEQITPDQIASPPTLTKTGVFSLLKKKSRSTPASKAGIIAINKSGIKKKKAFVPKNHISTKVIKAGIASGKASEYAGQPKTIKNIPAKATAIPLAVTGVPMAKTTISYVPPAPKQEKKPPMKTPKKKVKGKK